MVYLLLSVLASVAMAGIFKISEKKDLNRNMITTVNYIAAVIVSFIMVANNGINIQLNLKSWHAFGEEAINVFQGGQFTPLSISVFALLLGIITGTIYFIGLIVMQLSVRQYGAGLTGMFNKAGIFIPIILSIVLWNEFPSSIQWLGIGLALIGIILVNLSNETSKRFEIHLPLIILMLTGGFGALASKLFQVYAPIQYRDVFLMFVFGSALIISIVYTVRTAKPWDRNEVIAGIAVGICNQLAATFLLLALNVLPGPVVYPLTAAGSIIVSNLMGIAFFKERLKQREWVAIALTIVAVVMLS